MKKYLYTLLEEKGIDVMDYITVGEDPMFGAQIIMINDIVKFILSSDKNTQKQIRNKLVAIDFMNGDVMDFIKYIGRFMFKAAM